MLVQGELCKQPQQCQKSQGRKQDKRLTKLSGTRHRALPQPPPVPQPAIESSQISAGALRESPKSKGGRTEGPGSPGSRSHQSSEILPENLASREES